MSVVLSPQEIRVLGALIEKDMVTPEYYPLSLNALVNACNQKSNRDPMTAYSDEEVQETIEALRARHLISMTTGGSNRVPKYGHRASETLDLNNRELAVVCVLLLRGAQTLNEIRTRTESLHRFDDLDSVQSVLDRLAERGFAVLLARQTGMREPRWTHLFAGEPAVPSAREPKPASEPSDSLATRVARLETELAELRAELLAFRNQFEG
jgi:uncharacterized protein YceH (UPF0502 family)